MPLSPANEHGVRRKKYEFMNKLTGSSLLGFLMALCVIYWLKPLNNGAIALVIIVCCGVSVFIGGAVSTIFKRLMKNETD